MNKLREIVSERPMSSGRAFHILLLLQISFTAENPTHEGEDGLNHELTVAQFARVA